MVKISWQSLSADALTGVIDDFVLREGTEYGAAEVSLDAKRERVREQLRRELAVIWFDPETQSVTIATASD